MRAFIRQEDTQLRLDNTIVMWQGEPHWCRVSLDFPVNHVHITALEDVQTGRGKRKLVDLTSDDFSANIPELGYVNREYYCDFVSRSPERRQKQGLCVNTVKSASGNDPSVYMFTVEFRNMLKNVYPTFDEALTKVEQLGVARVAFHKQLALLKRSKVSPVVLEVRGREVATFNNETNIFEIHKDRKDYSFLFEMLTNLGIRV